MILEEIYDTSERRLVRYQAELKIEKESRALDPGKRDAAHPWSTLWKLKRPARQPDGGSHA